MTQSQTARIIDKIRKLLAMADSDRNDNDNERETALRQANSLMDKHGVSMLDMDDDSEADPNGERGESDTATGAAIWKAMLISHVAKLYGCKSYRTTGSRGRTYVVGREVHRTVVLSMSEYLMRSIEREVVGYRGRGRAFTGAFRKGAADGVGMQVDRILGARRNTGSAGTGMVLADYYRNEALANVRYMSDNGVRIRKSETYSSSKDGHSAGEAYGGKVSLNSQVSGRQAGSGMLRLGNG